MATQLPTTPLTTSSINHNNRSHVSSKKRSIHSRTKSSSFSTITTIISSLLSPSSYSLMTTKTRSHRCTRNNNNRHQNVTLKKNGFIHITILATIRTHVISVVVLLLVILWCICTMWYYTSQLHHYMNQNEPYYYYHHHHHPHQNRSSVIPSIVTPLEDHHHHNNNNYNNNKYNYNNRNGRNIKIPRILIFTHSVNLLQTNDDFRRSNVVIEKVTTTNQTTTTSHNTFNHHHDHHQKDYSITHNVTYTKEELDELRTLQENVYRIIALHRNTNNDNTTTTTLNPNHKEKDPSSTTSTTTVRFLTDHDCIQSIRQWAYMSRVTKPRHSNSHHHHRLLINDTDHERIANELIFYFQQESIGMYKADLCRGVALYETGGLYMDIDLGVRMNLYHVFLDTTEFVTVTVHRQSLYPGAFFQAFIAVVPYHDVIHRYIELFLLHYRRIIPIENGPIGVILLKRAYDEIQHEQQLEQQLSQPRPTRNETTTTATPMTYLQQTTELWQEVLYLPQYQNTIFSHIPMPTWGDQKRACKFVVVIPPTLDKNNNNNADDNTNTSTIIPKLIVPMYSRIAGSRMCPKNV